MIPCGFVPKWAREVFNLNLEETLSPEHLASILYNKRPPGLAVESESCLMWAGVLLEEHMDRVWTQLERVALELKLKEGRWPESGVDSNY